MLPSPAYLKQNFEFQALELDVSDVKIVEEKNPASSEDMIDRNVYELSDCSIAPHRFKHFKDIRVFRTIKSICFCIGQFADLNVVIDFLLEMFLSSSRHRKEVALFLNEILRSCIDVHSRGDFFIIQKHSFNFRSRCNCAYIFQKRFLHSSWNPLIYQIGFFFNPCCVSIQNYSDVEYVEK